jgi:hypothetical protein
VPFEIPWGLEADEAAACSQIGYLPLYLARDVFAVVDEEDFVWASQWKWSAKPSKNRKKLYACRTGYYAGRDISVFLHKAICLRAHGKPPSPSHIITDHINGNSLDCRRSNLRWATPSENRQNYAGVYALQLRLDFKTGGDRLLRAHTFGRLTQKGNTHGRPLQTDQGGARVATGTAGCRAQDDGAGGDRGDPAAAPF